MKVLHSWAPLAITFLIAAPPVVSVDDITMSVGAVQAHGVIAATQEQKANGVRGWHYFPKNEMMYFPDIRESTAQVFMDGVNLDLDIAFMRHGRVTQLAKGRACPLPATNCAITTSAAPIDAWIEAPAGALNHVKVGDKVTTYDPNTWDEP